MSRKHKTKTTEAQIPDTEAAPDNSLPNEEIALCAYYIWEEEGRPEGRAVEHWLQAELQLRATRTSDNASRPKDWADQHQEMKPKPGRQVDDQHQTSSSSEEKGMI